MTKATGDIKWALGKKVKGVKMRSITMVQEKDKERVEEVKVSRARVTIVASMGTD